MAESSFASLSPTLLARKGGAKPAMRPQHAALAAMPTIAPEADGEPLEDLGWNDMGDHDESRPSGEVVSLLRHGEAHAVPDLESEAEAEPAVLRQREAIATLVATAPAPESAPVASQSTPRGRKDRAAFTLRLDPVRHIKLRLACTMRDTSAQALVTEALDAFLGTMPELEMLAAQVKRR